MRSKAPSTREHIRFRGLPSVDLSGRQPGDFFNGFGCVIKEMVGYGGKGGGGGRGKVSGVLVSFSALPVHLRMPASGMLYTGVNHVEQGTQHARTH